MQGAIDDGAPKPSIIEKITETYNKRTTFSEFIMARSVSIPSSAAGALDRVKLNAARFAFYYMAIFGILDLLFVFVNRLIIIPIIITLFSVYLASEPVTVQEIVITPLHIVVGCVSLHLLIGILFKSMAKCYVYFFALNAFSLVLVFLHGAIVDPKVQDDDDDGV